MRQEPEIFTELLLYDTYTMKKTRLEDQRLHG